MGTAALRWIAPYWRALERGFGGPIDSAMVYVLNPSGHLGATVKRQWHFADGALLAEDQTVVDPLHTVMFSPVGDAGSLPAGFEMQGWVRLTSNHPIAPWGETPFRTSAGQPDGHTNMTFYREDSASLHSHHAS